MDAILASKTVFIDTCIFRNLNFRLDNEIFSRFRQLCQDGELEFVTTEITQKEIKRRMHEYASEAFISLQKFRDRTHLLPRLHSQWGKSYKGLSVEVLEQNLNIALRNWFSRTRAKTLPIPSNATKKVFDKYFKQEKPFSEGKKSEFPDAFVVQALINLKKRIYVISADGDFEGTSEEIIQLRSLGEFFQIYNSHTNEVADYVQKLVYKNEAKLISWIQAELGRIPAIPRDSDTQINSGELHVLGITDAWVVSFKRGTAEVSFGFKFQISGETREINEAGYVVRESDFQEEQQSQAQIKVCFDPNDDSVFSYYDLRFNEDLESGIEIG